MGILAPPSQGIVGIFIWRRIPSEIISQPKPGVVFEYFLLHSKLEYPDLPQPPKCLPVTAVDRHQGNVTKSDQKVYIERIEDPRGLAKPAEVSCQGGSRAGLTTRDVGGRLGVLRPI
jgi:hypothetical protein